MKYVFRIVAALFFLVFFGFALKNTQEVVLEFFWNYEWRGPLVLMLLAFFVAGTALGILAMVPTVFRQRRELARQRQLAIRLEKAQAQRIAAPTPDAVPTR